MDNPHASQIEFTPAGKGYVHVYLCHKSGDKLVEVLQYSRQGQVMGDERVDVKNARILNEAAGPLNEALWSI